MLNQINLARIDLNLLVLFEVVLQERHVGRAAEHLNLSPSAVSHGLGRLRRLLNDPLFIKTPKGVVPTARANELAAPIADLLGGARNVIAMANPFDPVTSTRRFTLGAPDGASVVILPPLMSYIARNAPHVNIVVRHLPFETAFQDLENRIIDIAITPLAVIPPRFVGRVLFDEDFVIAMREGHPFAKSPTFERFCDTPHLLVSLDGDVHGFVDNVLAKHGRKRRVALAVPSFMLTMAFLAKTDLIAALPRTMVTMYAHRFGLVMTEAPQPLMQSKLRAVMPKSASKDKGLAWLMDALEKSIRPKTSSNKRMA
jgi:DNA-binding transcriptional LysR family regulator